MGVTGARAQTSIAAPDLVRRVRAADSNALVGVGLGVSSGSQAWEVSQYADAVIVGSLLVKCLVDAEDAGRPAELSGLRAVVADLAGGIRRGAPQGAGTPVRRAACRSVSGTEYRGRARWALVVGVVLLLVSCTSPQPTVAHRPRPGRLLRWNLTAAAGHRIARRDPHRHLGQLLQPGDVAIQKPVVLLFFGYSHCPDVCVTVLADVAQALNRMEASDRDQIQMIFITTDPARDKPRVIASYLERFDPTFIGLTGDPLPSRPPPAGWRRHRRNAQAAERRLRGRALRAGHRIRSGTAKGVVLWTPETPIADLKDDFSLLGALPVSTTTATPSASPRRPYGCRLSLGSSSPGCCWPRACSRPSIPLDRLRPFAPMSWCRRPGHADRLGPAVPGDRVGPAAARGAAHQSRGYLQRLPARHPACGGVSVAARGLSIDCGCFGGGGPVASGETRYTSEILRDIGLLLLSLWLAWRPRTRFSLDRWNGGTPDECGFQASTGNGPPAGGGSSETPARATNWRAGRSGGSGPPCGWRHRFPGVARVRRPRQRPPAGQSAWLRWPSRTGSRSCSAKAMHRSSSPCTRTFTVRTAPSSRRSLWFGAHLSSREW